jgi:phosphoribosylformylglycinamidine (FGAM) synthase PurS component
MDSIEEQHREVYAWFGRAAAHSQELETTLKSVLLCHARLNNTVITSQELADLDQSFKMPLGPLIKKVRVQVGLSNHADSQIKAALTKRNFLIHDFFVERAFEFDTDAGRQRMLDELREISAFLLVADKLAIMLLEGLSERIGITKEALEAELARMKLSHDGKKPES